MQQFLQMIGVLVILLIVLRFSIGRRKQEITLRGGLTGLNVMTGLLAGVVLALLLPEFGLPAGALEVYRPLAGALGSILPLAGAAAGGILGYLLLGDLWRRLLVNGSASTRAWLRRSQFAVCAAAFILLVSRLA